MALRVSGYICFVSSGSCYSCREDTAAAFSHQFHVFRAMVFVSLQRFLQRSSGCESGAQVYRCCSTGSIGLSIAKSWELWRLGKDLRHPFLPFPMNDLSLGQSLQCCLSLIQQPLPLQLLAFSAVECSSSIGLDKVFISQPHHSQRQVGWETD